MYYNFTPRRLYHSLNYSTNKILCLINKSSLEFYKYSLVLCHKQIKLHYIMKNNIKFLTNLPNYDNIITVIIINIEKKERRYDASVY